MAWNSAFSFPGIVSRPIAHDASSRQAFIAVSSSTSPACRSLKMRSSSPSGKSRLAQKRCAAYSTATSRSNLQIRSFLSPSFFSGPLHAASRALKNGSRDATGAPVGTSFGTPLVSAHFVTSPTNSVPTRALGFALSAIQVTSWSPVTSGSASFARSGVSDPTSPSKPCFASTDSIVAPSSLSMFPRKSPRVTFELSNTCSALGVPKLAEIAPRIRQSTGKAPPSSLRYPTSPSGPASAHAVATAAKSTLPSATAPASTVAKCVSAKGKSHLWSSRSSSTSLIPATRPSGVAGPPTEPGSRRNKAPAACQSIWRRSNPDTTRFATNEGTLGSKEGPHP
mmetsp:Transcript_1351/g.4534  ORF Transcript_1351/g.4534 Transcript_1351/m.4534 type:complete len:338 (+) Transcript_1351:1093-2106(+)